MSNDCFTSLNVVEPMHRRVPEANAGFSRLPASIVPPDAEPAPDQRVDLVDEQDGVRLLLEGIQHLLDALLEIAAVAGPGDERAEVQGEHARVLQRGRHGPFLDAPGEALGQCRLADPGLADQQRVVLAPAAEHLHHALHFQLAADQRVDLPAGGLGHQVGGVGLERLTRRGRGVGIRRGHRSLRISGPMGQRPKQAEAIQALFAEEVGRVAVVFLEQEDEQRPALHLLGTRRGGVHDGPLDHAIEADRGLGLHGPASRHRRERALQHVVEVVAQRREVDATGLQQAQGQRILEQRREQVLEADEIVPAIGGQPEGAANALERFWCERYRLPTHSVAPSGSGSTVTSSGNSCCSARRCVAFCLVSATSRV